MSKKWWRRPDVADYAETMKEQNAMANETETPITILTGTLPDRLNAFADRELPGSQLQSDLYAAATLLRKSGPYASPAQQAQPVEPDQFLGGLREALALKPNTPQLENALSYAWTQALKERIRVLSRQDASPAQQAQPVAPQDEARELLARLVALVPEPPLVHSHDSPPEHRTQEEHELGYTLHLARAYLNKTEGKHG